MNYIFIDCHVPRNDGVVLRTYNRQNYRYKNKNPIFQEKTLY